MVVSDDFETLHIYYQNVRGLKTKLSTTYLLSQQTNFDLFCFTETFLDSTVLDTEIFDSEYFTVFRTDRSNLNSSKKSGGGVLIAAKCDYPANSFDLLNSDVEMVAVKLKFSSHHVYLFCVYIPPNMPAELYQKCSENIKIAIEDCSPDDRFLICGDFNLPDVDWLFFEEDNCFLPISSSGDKAVEFLGSLSSFSLHQVNSICNHMNRLLDLVLYDDPNEVKIAETKNALPLDMYHPALEICLSLECKNTFKNTSSPSEKMTFVFKKARFDELRDYLSQVDWDAVLCNNDLTKDLENFYTVMYESFERYVPKRKIKPKDKRKPWMNDELKKLKNRKNKLHKKLKKVFNDEANCEYQSISNELEQKMKTAYENYIIKVKSGIMDEPKNFWNFVNTKRKVSANPTSICHEGNVINDDQDICNVFADFFQSVYRTYPNADNVNIIDSNDSFDPPVLCPKDIESALKDVKSSFVPGPDNIPAALVKRCSSVLCVPLCYLFNLSLSTGEFSDVWKSSYLIPLFKAGDRRVVLNYRGIAKLNVIPKLLESCIYDHMFFNVKAKLSPKQHGFFKGRSIQTNLLTLTGHITESFSQKLQTDVGYFDFSKAFDQVHHDILLNKLKWFGFSTVYLKWIESYLTRRSQRVFFNNCLSKTITVSSGVPQGSHLGPLFFFNVHKRPPPRCD